MDKKYQLITYDKYSGFDEKPSFKTIKEAVDYAKIIKKYNKLSYLYDQYGFIIYNIKTKEIIRIYNCSIEDYFNYQQNVNVIHIIKKL